MASTMMMNSKLRWIVEVSPSNCHIALFVKSWEMLGDGMLTNIIHVESIHLSGLRKFFTKDYYFFLYIYFHRAFVFYCQGPLWRLIEIKSSIHQGSCTIVITRLLKEIWNLSGICLEYISQNGWYIRQDCLQESPGETLLRLLPSLPTSLVICKNDCLFLLHPTNQPSNQPSNQTCLSLPLPPPPLLLAASCTPQSMVVIITW